MPDQSEHDQHQRDKIRKIRPDFIEKRAGKGSIKCITAQLKQRPLET